MANGPMDLAIGSILLVLAGVITFVVLPIANDAIDDFADGTNDTLGDADDPPATQVTLAELFPLVVIAVLVVGGVAELVRGARSLRGA